MKFKYQIYVCLIIIAIIFYKLGSNNSQCSQNSGVWVGYETLFPIKLLNKNILYKDYSNLYIKSNLKFTNNTKINGCKIVYDWYEDGLSLNYLTPQTKDLVFTKKVDGKYWLDIKKSNTKIYILSKFKKYKKLYPNSKLHLDDHWSIPAVYGDYEHDLNMLTKEVYDIVGPFSLSVLPLNYSVAKYNANWLEWVDNNYINEIILQNYTLKNYTLELNIFYNQLNSYTNINKGVGLYIRESTNKQDLIYLNKLNKSKNFNTYHFSLRTSLLLDLKTRLQLNEKN